MRHAPRALLTSLLFAIAVAVPVARSGPPPCRTDKCAATACQGDLDCPRGCVCSQDMDEKSRGVCVPTTNPL